MASKKKPQTKRQPSKPQQSVFREAWENMSEDFNRLLPETLRNKDKKKFVLWLFVVEMVVLGGVGWIIYEWVVGK